METINQSKEYELFLNNSNSFENNLNIASLNRNSDEIKNLSNSFQIPPSIISSLGNMEDVRRFLEIRKFIISNRNNLNNMKASPSPSITIPSFTSNLNNISNISNISNTTSSLYSNNIINNINSLQNNKASIPSISIPNDNINTMNSKYLYNNNNSPNLKDNELFSFYGTQLNTPTLMPLNTFNSINIPSTTTTASLPSNSNNSIGNIINPFSKLNSTSSFSLPPSPLSLDSTVSFPTNQNQLYLNPNLTTSTSINNSYNTVNNLSDSKTLSLKQLELMNLIKLISQKQTEEKNKRKTTDDNLVIPSMLPLDSVQNENNFINSISNVPTMEEKINCPSTQKQINEDLIKCLQLQQSTSNTSTSSLNNFNNINCENTIPSIIINDESNNLLTLSPQELDIKNDVKINENDSLDILSLLSKTEETNNYAPLSPALSPVLNSDLVEPSSKGILDNCIKKNENNIFSSMETLNDVLTITPEMESVKTPDIESNIKFSLNDECINNENENDIFLGNVPLDSLIEAIEAEDNKIKEQLEETNNNLLNTPATPKSISNSLDLSNNETTEFSDCIECLEENNIFNNESILSNILNDTLTNSPKSENINLNFKDELNTTTTSTTSTSTSTNDTFSIDPLLALNDSTLELNNSSRIIEGSDSLQFNENKKSNEIKRPRGRPRKKKSVQSPKEKIEEISKSIDNLLSSEFYNKLYSEKRNNSIIHQKNLHPKKVCFNQDYKFVKEVNTLNYIIVSYKRMCTALCQNNELNIEAISEDTENQYDIPLKSKEEDSNEESEDKRCQDNNDLIKESYDDCEECEECEKIEECEECEKVEECEEGEKIEENKESDFNLDKNIADIEANDRINEIDEINKILSCEESKISYSKENIDIITDEDEDEDEDESEDESENMNEKGKSQDEENESSDNSEEESLLIKMKKIQEQQKIKINNKEDESKKSKNHHLRSRSISCDENKNENEYEDENTKQKNKTIENTKKNTRKRKRQTKEINEKDLNSNDKTEVYVDTVTNNNKRKKVVRLSITQIKDSLENGNSLTIGNSLGTNSVSALTKNGLVLIGRKRMIAENTNRPYVCSTCGAGFARKHDLNRHEKVHTGIKNYKCPYCERGFSRNDALTRHIRVELKHRAKNEELNKDGKKKYKKDKI